MHEREEVVHARGVYLNRHLSWGLRRHFSFFVWLHFFDTRAATSVLAPVFKASGCLLDRFRLSESGMVSSAMVLVIREAAGVQGIQYSNCCSDSSGAINAKVLM